MPDVGGVETYVDDVPEQRARQSEAVADRHAADAIDKQLEADLRVSLNMDGWPINLVFSIRVEDVNDDYVFAPSYPEYDADQVFYYEYGDGASFDGNHTLQKWVTRHSEDLARMGAIERALETGEFV